MTQVIGAGHERKEIKEEGKEEEKKRNGNLAASAVIRSRATL
jgi:hypothetical protein